MLIHVLLIVLLSTAVPSSEEARCDAERLYWAEDLKIGIGDFLDKPRNPANTAEANTGIAMQSYPGRSPDMFRVEVKAFFDPCKSWFRRTDKDLETLTHERIHFDISEVHARILLKRYATEIVNFDGFSRKHEQLYNEVWKKSRATQERYDKEVYADRSKQAEWAKWVQDELEKYAAYSSKNIELPFE